MKHKLGLVSGGMLVLSSLGVWHFGYKYYWWIYYPSLRHTIGGPEVTTTEGHLWTYGLAGSVILAVLSLIGIVKFLVDRRQHKRAVIFDGN